MAGHEVSNGADCDDKPTPSPKNINRLSTGKRGPESFPVCWLKIDQNSHKLLIIM